MPLFIKWYTSYDGFDCRLKLMVIQNPEMSELSPLVHLHGYVWKTILKCVLRVLSVDMALELSLHLY